MNNVYWQSAYFDYANSDIFPYIADISYVCSSFVPLLSVVCYPILSHMLSWLSADEHLHYLPSTIDFIIITEFVSCVRIIGRVRCDVVSICSLKPFT